MTNIGTKRGLRITGLAALIASTAAVQSIAAQIDSVVVEVGECVDLPSPEQRLACFEAQVEAARNAPPAAAAAAAPAAAAAAASSSTAPEDFGLREPEPKEVRELPPEIHAKVVELRETVPNAFLITLDNGQVWRQTQPRYDYALRPGSVVRIYASRWRSFRLDSPQQRGYIQVERVR
jgi:hypothetical protein